LIYCLAIGPLRLDRGPASVAATARSSKRSQAEHSADRPIGFAEDPGRSGPWAHSTFLIVVSHGDSRVSRRRRDSESSRTHPQSRRASGFKFQSSRGGDSEGSPEGRTRSRQWALTRADSDSSAEKWFDSKMPTWRDDRLIWKDEQPLPTSGISSKAYYLVIHIK
jgi:hypothetical protein